MCGKFIFQLLRMHEQERGAEIALRRTCDGQKKQEILIPTCTAPETFSHDVIPLAPTLLKLIKMGFLSCVFTTKSELANQAFVDRRCIIHHLHHHHHHEAAPPLQFLQQSCIDAPLRFRPSLPLVLSLLCR